MLVGEGVLVPVAVNVGDGVTVAVNVGVTVRVAVGVGVDVGMGVDVGVGVAVAGAPATKATSRGFMPTKMLVPAVGGTVVRLTGVTVPLPKFAT